MLIREAVEADIPQLQVIRGAVKENVLSDPALVTEAHYRAYLTERGKGWVCEVEGAVVGFAIISLTDHNVWALFVLPWFEGKGIGRRLQQVMLHWYFSQTQATLWLSTDAHSRAALFYQQSGWQPAGPHNNTEIKFEMPFDAWQQHFAR